MTPDRAAVLLLSLVMALPALAKEKGGDIRDELELLRQEETVEIAAKRPQPISEVPSAVSLITRREIEDAPALSLIDVFRSVPGMDVRALNPFETMMGLRAMTSDMNNLILVLIDGREMNQEIFDWTFWSFFPIGLLDIERIEVIRGPGSALYGANAYAGVVNIITRKPDRKPKVEARVFGGPFHVFQGAARGTFGGERWAVALSSGFDTENRWHETERLGVTATRGRAAVDLTPTANLRLGIDAGLSRGKGHTFLAIGETWTQATEAYAKLNLDYRDFKAQFYWTRTAMNFDLHLDVIAGGVEIMGFRPMDVETNVYDLQLQYQLKLAPAVSVTLGNGTRLATSFSDDTIPRFLTEWRNGSFAQLELQALKNRLSVTAGARVDLNSLTDTAVSPRLSVVVAPRPEHHIRASFAMAFKKPPLVAKSIHLGAVECRDISCETLQLYRFFTEGIGNPAVKNETVRSIELGYTARLADGRLRIALDLFYNQYRDFLDFNIGGLDFSQAFVGGQPNFAAFSFNSNNEPFDAFGGELVVEGYPAPWLRLFASWSPRRVWKNDFGSLAEREPYNTVIFGFRLRAPWGLKAAATLRFVSGYKRDLRDPASVANEWSVIELGNDIDLRFRVTQTVKSASFEAEFGIVGQSPITTRSSFRESPGTLTSNGTNYGADPQEFRVLGILELRHRRQ